MSNIETLDLLWCKLIVATMDATTPEFSITLNKEECMEAIKGMEELKETLNDLNSLVKCIAEKPKEEMPKTETMTLEQAINHLEEELKNKQDWSCVACKEDHQQLLEWLKTLQAIRMNIETPQGKNTCYLIAKDNLSNDENNLIERLLQE